MARDALLSSVKKVVSLGEDVEDFVIWVKRYKSGRTRVLLPAGYEVIGIINNGVLTDDCTVELQPKKKEGVKR